MYVCMYIYSYHSTSRDTREREKVRLACEKEEVRLACGDIQQRESCLIHAPAAPTLALLKCTFEDGQDGGASGEGEAARTCVGSSVSS